MDPKHEHLYKIIIVGSTSTGKSSLLLRMVDCKFDPDFPPTVSVDFKLLTVDLNTKQINLQIWDTAGQQKFASLTDSYFRRASGCLCVYDCTREETLTKTEQHINKAKSFGISSQCIFVVANKCDETDNNNSIKNGKQLANQHNVNFMQTSAKSGEGVNNLLNTLAVKLDNTYSNENSSDSKIQKVKIGPIIKIQEQTRRRWC